MLKVLGRTTSINTQKVLWTLAELELPFTREDFGGPFGVTRLFAEYEITEYKDEPLLPSLERDANGYGGGASTTTQIRGTTASRWSGNQRSLITIAAH